MKTRKFTLVELLVTIAIIAILAALLLPAALDMGAAAAARKHGDALELLHELFVLNGHGGLLFVGRGRPGARRGASAYRL